MCNDYDNCFWALFAIAIVGDKIFLKLIYDNGVQTHVSLC